MTHHTDAERAEFEAWARGYGTWEVKRDDDVVLGTTGYTDITLTVAWYAVQAARRAPSMTDQSIIEAVDGWFARNTGLGGCSDKDVAELAAIFAAAPQPPEAAPVQLPEPVAYQWLSTDNFRISGGPVSGAYWNKLYTEQQVRQLLANHGIQEQST